eukprot:6727085-Alexandrium_andersonii.AAC.1
MKRGGKTLGRSTARSFEGPRSTPPSLADSCVLNRSEFRAESEFGVLYCSERSAALEYAVPDTPFHG